MWVGKWLIELIPHFLYFYFTTQRQSNLMRCMSTLRIAKGSRHSVTASTCWNLYYNNCIFQGREGWAPAFYTPVQWTAHWASDGTGSHDASTTRPRRQTSRQTGTVCGLQWVTMQCRFPIRPCVAFYSSETAT